MSVGEGCCGNGWGGESPNSGCNSALLLWNDSTSPGVSKRLCHCLPVVPCCFVLLCAREDAPLTADWEKGGFHFTCSTKGVFKQCILAAGVLSEVQMQHSEPERVSSDPTVGLCFSGSWVYLLRLLNSPNPVP